MALYVACLEQIKGSDRRLRTLPSIKAPPNSPSSNCFGVITNLSAGSARSCCRSFTPRDAIYFSSNSCAGARPYLSSALTAQRRLLSTFRDRPVKQPLGGWRSHKPCDTAATGGFAENGNVIWIAAEGCDIFPDPFQRCDLIHDPVVAHRFVIFRCFLR